MEARCQCNLVHFQIPHPKPLALVVCHCKRCKLITGSVYNIAAIFPWFDFQESQAAANLSTITQTSDSGSTITGYFCKGCGNRMLHTKGVNDKEMISISAPRIVDFDWKLLEDKELTLHFWTSNAVVPVPEGFKTFEGQPRP